MPVHGKNLQGEDRHIFETGRQVLPRLLSRGASSGDRRAARFLTLLGCKVGTVAAPPGAAAHGAQRGICSSWPLQVAATDTCPTHHWVLGLSTQCYALRGGIGSDFEPKCSGERGA